MEFVKTIITEFWNTTSEMSVYLLFGFFVPDRPMVFGLRPHRQDRPPSGGRHPVTPWGVPTKGFKTRVKKASDKMIVKKRK